MNAAMESSATVAQARLNVVPSASLRRVVEKNPATQVDCRVRVSLTAMLCAPVTEIAALRSDTLRDKLLRTGQLAVEACSSAHRPLVGSISRALLSRVVRLDFFFANVAASEEKFH